MRTLPVIGMLFGAVWLGAGGVALFAVITHWGILDTLRSPDFNPENYRWHVVGTGIFALAVGVAFLIAAIGLWRRSSKAAKVLGHRCLYFDGNLVSGVHSSPFSIRI